MTIRLVPLKHLVGINERSLGEDTDPGYTFRYVDIGAVGHGALVAEPQEMTFEKAPSRARRIVRPGDTIVSTVRTYLRAVWPVPDPADDLVVSTGFAVLTPHNVDPRYFSWWARSDPFIEEIAARSVGVSYPAINPLQLGELKVRVPSAREQRAIADYLDAETARIDALIAKKRSLAAAVRARASARIESLIVSAVQREVPLRRLLAEPPTYGAAESGVEGEPDWPRYIRITDLDSDGELRRSNALRLPPDVAQPFLLEHGDLLIARSGATVGKAFLYQRSMGPAAFAGYLIRFRPDQTMIIPELLWAWTLTSHFWQQVRLAALQATIENVSADKYKEFRVPLPMRVAQHGLMREVERSQKQSKAIIGRLTRQVSLLSEHRQALITAAVTGELDVPGVAA